MTMKAAQYPFQLSVDGTPLFRPQRLCAFGVMETSPPVPSFAVV